MTKFEPTLTTSQVREIDRRAIEEYGLPGIALMENAGRGCAELLLARGVHGPVVVCCGPGNNGGDGFVIARHLDVAGCDVRVLLFADPERLGGDAAVNARVVRQSGLTVETFQAAPPPEMLEGLLQPAAWIVDALLGTGSRGEVREPLRSAIAAINRSGRRVLAVDLPSGLDADTGVPGDPCVRADVTATFVARKRGFEAPAAQTCLGEVVVVGIGAPRRLLAEFGLA